MKNDKKDFSIWGALLIVLGMIIYAIFGTPLIFIVGIIRFILVDVKE